MELHSKISIRKWKYFTALFDTGAEISVINSVAFEQLELFNKLYDSNILVCNARMEKVMLKFDINGRNYTHTFIVCSSLK